MPTDVDTRALVERHVPEAASDTFDSFPMDCDDEPVASAPRTPLATLDALHLAGALPFGCDGFATSDQHLSRAAASSGLVVHDFFD